MKLHITIEGLADLTAAVRELARCYAPSPAPAPKKSNKGRKAKNIKSPFDVKSRNGEDVGMTFFIRNHGLTQREVVAFAKGKGYRNLGNGNNPRYSKGDAVRILKHFGITF